MLFHYFFLILDLSQDIIFRFKERRPGKESWTWSEFPSKVAVQLNDTHPTLAIPELMRLLMDDEGLGWDEAWDVTTRCGEVLNLLLITGSGDHPSFICLQHL